MDPESIYKICLCLGGGLCMGLGAIGPAYGIGMAAGKACESAARQPKAAGSITKMMLVGQAVSESPAIFALLIAICLLFKKMPEEITFFNFAALISAGICTGLGAIGPGVGAGIANSSACEGIGRDPELEAPLLRTMLIGQAVSQSTSVYALVISMCLLFVL